MQLIPQEERTWRPIQLNMPSAKIGEALQKIFNDNPQAVEQYAQPETLNGLFAWATVDSLDIKMAFLLHTGLDATSSPARSSKRVSTLLDQSPNQVGTYYNYMAIALRKGHRLIEHAPAEARLSNPYRELGLPVKVWQPLAREGIFTLNELCGRETNKLRRLKNFGPLALGLLQQQLVTKGLSLR